MSHLSPKARQSGHQPGYPTQLVPWVRAGNRAWRLTWWHGETLRVVAEV
jgi:hypothetical protein